MDTKELSAIARDARIDVLEMIYASQSSHIGSAFSIVDILAVLYFSVMDQDRGDRFILSKGHAASALYAILRKKNFLGARDKFCQDNSVLCGHVSKFASPEIFASTGSLGHGLPIACGCALAKKLDEKQSKVFCLMGDGECNEGSVWEAANFAHHNKLDNLVAIIDRNNLQGLGAAEEVISMEPLKDKWESFGWNFFECDGHSFEELMKIFSQAIEKNNGKPSVIIAKTIKGKGVSFMENNFHWHYKSPDEKQYNAAKEELLKSA